LDDDESRGTNSAGGSKEPARPLVGVWGVHTNSNPLLPKAARKRKVLNSYNQRE
jgi:hypothetical protein